MTKKHFIDAAAIVKAIRDGQSTNEPPVWMSDEDASAFFMLPPLDTVSGSRYGLNDGWHYTRAAIIAAAFIHLFSAANPRFDRDRFLIACGLVMKPAKAKRPRSRKPATPACEACSSTEGAYVPPGSGDAHCLHCGEPWEGEL